jgi:hypothetical protein
MKGTLNPFEPWRPVADRIPPPLHVSRPWRPPPPPPVRSAIEEPPFVEPVKPLPRNKPPERPQQPQRQAGQPSPPRLPIPEWTLVLVVACIMVFPGIVGACGTHAARVLALVVSAIIFAGMAFDNSNSRSWPTRLTWIVGANAFAGIALWFVPTLHGVNLWSAYRQIEELRALPAGDVAAYQRGAAARRTLVKAFPSFAADVKAAEQAWFRRIVDEAVENADRQLDKDPAAALARLQQLDKQLSRLDHYASVRKELGSARRRAVQACVKVAQKP